MSERSLLRCCALTSLVLSVFTVTCLAQQVSEPSSYIEISWMRVKQDKVAEFNQLALRVADANRRGNGDNWIAFMDMYGRDNSIWFASARQSLNDVEPGMNKFMGAIKEFMGYSPDRIFAEISKTVEASGTQLCRPRLDLGWNVKDMAD